MTAARRALELAEQAADRAAEHHPRAATDALASIALSLAATLPTDAEPRPPLVGNATYDPANALPGDVASTGGDNSDVCVNIGDGSDEPWMVMVDGDYRWSSPDMLPAGLVLIARGGRPVVRP